MSSVINAYREGGSWCKGVVYSTHTVLSIASGFLIQDHMHLPLVALATRWGLLANVEGLSMVVQGAAQ
jgi:hypothetical protein